MVTLVYKWLPLTLVGGRGGRGRGTGIWARLLRGDSKKNDLQGVQDLA